ncbi:hypothetical protein DPMN_040339 [Dreissena polymorpha]|uniref:Uncharacterized protein n=1 Tax=Dreissena polymorpha TaxID=45954 RepID=A0A9D4HSZ1_DREPO|nr:hypothetical protein DPMN_040339 [Dreissena polymorpha]
MVSRRIGLNRNVYKTAADRQISSRSIWEITLDASFKRCCPGCRVPIVEVQRIRDDKSAVAEDNRGLAGPGNCGRQKLR